MNGVRNSFFKSECYQAPRSPYTHCKTLLPFENFASHRIQRLHNSFFFFFFSFVSSSAEFPWIVFFENFREIFGPSFSSFCPCLSESSLHIKSSGNFQRGIVQHELVVGAITTPTPIQQTHCNCSSPRFYIFKKPTWQLQGE